MDTYCHYVTLFLGFARIRGHNREKRPRQQAELVRILPGSGGTYNK